MFSVETAPSLLQLRNTLDASRTDVIVGTRHPKGKGTYPKFVRALLFTVGRDKHSFLRMRSRHSGSADMSLLGIREGGLPPAYPNTCSEGTRLSYAIGPSTLVWSRPNGSVVWWDVVLYLIESVARLANTT